MTSPAPTSPDAAPDAPAEDAPDARSRRAARTDAPAPTPPARPHRRLEIAVAAAVAVVPVVVALVHAAGQSWLPTADNALIELRSLDIPTHVPLVGVYSRFGFHHPGPILFFVNTLPLHLIGPKGLLLATGLTNAAALVGTVVVFDRRGGRPLLLAGTAVLLLTERALAGQLLDPWNPWVTTLPFALLVVAVWSVWCRDWLLLPVAAVAGTYVAQAHLGFALLVAALGGASFAFALWSWWRARAGGTGAHADAVADADPDAPADADDRVVRAGCSGRVLLVTVGVLAVLWALPVVDLVTQHPNNVNLIRQSLQHPEQPPAGPGQATDVLVHGVGASLPWITGAEEVEPFSNRVLGADAWTLLPLLAAVAAGAVLAVRARARPAARDALRFQVVVGVAAVVGWVSVVRITGNAYPYLVRWMWVIGAFAWLSAAWAAFTGWPRRPRPVTPPLGVAAAVLAVLGVLAGVAAYQAALPAPADAVATRSVVDQAMGDLAGRGTLAVRHEGTDLAEIPQGVFAELDRRGLPVFVTADDAFVAGEHHALGDRRADATLVVATSDAVDFHLRAGETPIASYDRLTPDERTEYLALAARAAAGYGQATRGEPITDPMNEADTARVRDLASRATRVSLFVEPAP